MNCIYVQSLFFRLKMAITEVPTLGNAELELSERDQLLALAINIDSIKF
jgi:hypothetical protein